MLIAIIIKDCVLNYQYAIASSILKVPEVCLVDIMLLRTTFTLKIIVTLKSITFRF